MAETEKMTKVERKAQKVKQEQAECRKACKCQYIFIQKVEYFFTIYHGMLQLPELPKRLVYLLNDMTVL